jgi:hypothetical protein
VSNIYVVEGKLLSVLVIFIGALKLFKHNCVHYLLIARRIYAKWLSLESLPHTSGLGMDKVDCILTTVVLLVQVLKHEWPARWPRFIPDLVSAAKSSETLCENCMVILKVNMMLSFVQFLTAKKDCSSTFFSSRVTQSNFLCVSIQLLSEEVFDFSRGELTQSKIKELKHSLNK